MKRINYTGSSKLISRIVDLINRKVPMPTDSQDNIDWGTNGQVLITDGSGSTSWGTATGGTDENVKQTATTGNYDFRVLLSATATDGDYTGVVKKNTNLKYNASTGNLQVPKINGVDVGSAPEFTDIKVLFGTCPTAASDPDKKVVLSGTTLTDAQYSSLPLGTFLCVKFANTNSASNCTLSIVDTATNPTKYTTPASIYYNASVYTGSSNFACGYANRHNYYVWSGTEWVWVTRGVETEFSNMSTSELVTGTATNQRTVRADYLNAGIQDLITQNAWAIKNTVAITATSESHADLNDYKTPGNYSSASSSVSQYIDNAPTTSAGFNLIVMRIANGDSRLRQIVFVNSSTYIFTRYYASSTWSSWVNIAKDTTYTAITQSQIFTGTDTTLRTVRADYLKAGIQDIITQDAWSTHNATTITATSESRVDLNDYNVPGNFMCTSNNTSEYIDNKPTGTTKSAFRLIVIRPYNTTTYIRQFAIVHGSNAFYSRYYNTSGWSSWANYNTNTTYSALTASELVTGTATTLRTVRADYLNSGIKQIAQERVESSNTAVGVGRSSGYGIMGNLPVYEAFLTKSQTYQYNTDSAMQEQYYVKMPFTSEYGSNRFIIYEADFWIGALTSATRYKMEPENISMSMSSGDDEAVITVNFKAINKGTISGALSGHIKFSEYID